MSKSKDIDIYSNGITRSSRECEERRTIGLELTKLQKKLVIKFHGEYIRHKNRWLAITYSHNSQVNTLPVPTKHVSSAQHIKIKNFDNEKKKPILKNGVKFENGGWMKENDQLGMKRSGGDNVVEELPPNAAATHQNHRNCLHFFFFSGVQLQRLLLAVSSF